MPLYDADNRLTADACAVRARDNDNLSIAAYSLAKLRADAPPTTHVVANRNLRLWDGYGVTPAGAIDNDSQMRVDSEVTHHRHKIQLATRVFTASPDLSHGQASPELEAQLVSGLSTTRRASDASALSPCPRAREQQCKQQLDTRVHEKLAEREWDRFDPAVRPVSVANVVPPWTNGGAPSRDIARSDDFLRGMGYVHDGRAWRRHT